MGGLALSTRSGRSRKPLDVDGSVEAFGRVLPCESSVALDFSDLCQYAGRVGVLAPERDLVTAACQLLAWELNAAYGVPVWKPKSLVAHQAAALESWAEQGYLAGYSSVQFVDDDDDEQFGQDDDDKILKESDDLDDGADVASAAAEPEDDEAPPMLVKITEEEQRKDLGLERKRKVLEGTARLSSARASSVHEYWELYEDKLYRRTFNDSGDDVRALAVPDHMRAAILAFHHHPLSTGGGHRGGRR